MGRRVFLVVLDSVGIGALPDAGLYGDEGSNTLAAAAGSSGFSMPNMEKLGLFDIEGVKHLKKSSSEPEGAFGRLMEASKGKDTTIGHWEIAGKALREASSVLRRQSGGPSGDNRGTARLCGRKIKSRNGSVLPRQQMRISPEIMIRILLRRQDRKDTSVCRPEHR